MGDVEVGQSGEMTRQFSDLSCHFSVNSNLSEIFLRTEN
jgi:hypothetical protein